MEWKSWLIATLAPQPSSLHRSVRVGAQQQLCHIIVASSSPFHSLIPPELVRLLPRSESELVQGHPSPRPREHCGCRGQGRPWRSGSRWRRWKSKAARRRSDGRPGTTPASSPPTASPEGGSICHGRSARCFLCSALLCSAIFYCIVGLLQLLEDV